MRKLYLKNVSLVYNSICNTNASPVYVDNEPTRVHKDYDIWKFTVLMEYTHVTMQL